MTDDPTDKKLSERFAEARDAKVFSGALLDEVQATLRLAESHPFAIDIQPFGHETSEPWPGQQPTANALAEAIAEMATNDRWGLIQRVRAIIVRDRATVRARWEKHPSAIREAVDDFSHSQRRHALDR